MRRKLKITLYSTDNSIRAAIRAAFKGHQYELLEITDSVKAPRPGINEQQQPGTVHKLNLPDKVDFVVSNANLNRDSEGLAARLALRQNRNDVYAVTLPEALGYLHDKLEQFGELILVGADQGK